MQKSLLDVYLGKVAAGDESFIDKLCSQLTDRLCYIAATQVDSEFNQATVNVVRIKRDERSFVPLFTHERKFKSWSQSIQEKVEPVSLLGGDLCAVLGPDTGVLIDPGAENSVELSPSVVATIATQVLSTEPESDFAQDFEEEPAVAMAPAWHEEAAGPLNGPVARENGKGTYDPFSTNPGKLDVIDAPANDADEIAIAQKALISGDTALDMYDSIIGEADAAKTAVAPRQEPAAKSPVIEAHVSNKKGSFLGFIKKVVGHK
jgi:hypothetical protein